jgi:MoaA/NifB/PqqE/SkfB family radical SAM enzyme
MTAVMSPMEPAQRRDHHRPVRRADVKVGFACNNRCLFCAQGDKRERCGVIALEELLPKLRAGREHADALVLTGGEPTLHKQILGLVRAARLHGYRSIQLQTNGRMLSYPDRLQALLDAGITEISPSIHGPDAETHDALTRAPGSFDESALGIQNAVRSGVPVVTNTVITRHNFRVLDRIVTLLAELGVRQAQLAFVHPVGTAQQRFDQVVPALSQLSEPLARARTVAIERALRLVTEAVPLCFLQGMHELAVESAIPDTMVLDLDGKLDYSSWRKAEGKIQGPPCQSCALRNRCEGPWREYPEHFGWQEFIPL